MRHRARVSALAVVLGGLLLLGILAGSSMAVAQEYGESRGRLGVGHRLDVSGGGFAADSAVRMELISAETGDATDLGTVTSDRTGALAGSVALPDGLAPGAYTLTATGVTADGVTRVLSAELGGMTVAAGRAAGEPSGGMSLWLVAGLPVLALALAGDGWWWFLIGRKRGRAERPIALEGLPGEAGERAGWRPPAAWSPRGQGEVWAREVDL